MRKLIATEYLTLDGVMEDPGQWSRQFWNGAAAQFKFDELFASDVMLLGRVTYEGFAQAWPTMTDEAGFSDRMNGMPKYVASTTLTQADWNNSHIISVDVPAAVAKLKAADGQPILLAGSGVLFQSLMESGLVDEVRLMVHPLVLGRGKRLFNDGIDRSNMQLTGTQVFDSGIIVLTYALEPTA